MSGYKVLIVEDDRIIAKIAQDILTDEGYYVCGIARTVHEGVALARQHEPDLALIDLSLADGGIGTTVAAQLAPFGKLGILYSSGDVEQLPLTANEGHACLTKPYRSADLLQSLQIVASLVSTGKAEPPFPKELQLLFPGQSR
jgi:CheY-like chemotaxis protein